MTQDQGVRRVEVSAGLVFRDGRLLITRRPAGTHLAGLWEFPGGKRESGETWEACLVRELREELGVGVKVGGLFEEVTHVYPEKTVVLRFFLARLEREQEEPRALGCAEVRWVTREQLGEQVFPEADARILERLRGEGAGWGGDERGDGDPAA
jgi:mutator protein MutT